MKQQQKDHLVLEIIPGSVEPSGSFSHGAFARTGAGAGLLGVLFFCFFLRVLK